MKMTAKALSEYLGGTLEGDPDVEVFEPARIEDGMAGSVGFIANPKYEHFAYTTGCSVLIINKDLNLKEAVKPVLIRVEDAYTAFSRVLEKYQSSENGQTGIEQPSFIPASAVLGKNLYIGAFSYISENVKVGDNVHLYPNVFLGANVEIGNNTVIYPGARIYKDTKIGAECVIHANVVIGSDGFGFAPQADGSFRKIPQTGNVVIEDNVEIGANTTIDRATVGSTFIKKGVKIDNLVQIAHNVEIGENTVVAAQAGISGSTKIGANVMVGGQAGFVGHISIADGAKINAQSGVSKSIKEKGATVTGSPAFDYTASLRSQAIYKSLPELQQKINVLEEAIKNISKEGNK